MNFDKGGDVSTLNSVHIRSNIHAEIVPYSLEP